ncbi:MAG: 4Fe-4S dicluster domain-containing protein [Chlorobi bacterium]|nr:4Fe-4S dicluster domain-containing protein [Chlorobiota bacterium]
MINIILYFFSASAFLLFSTAAFISLKENEAFAVKRFSLLTIVSPLPFLSLALFDFAFKNEITIALFILIGGFVVVVLLPIGKNKNYRQTIPAQKQDERDIMFSRSELEPDSENFENYYSRNPDKKELDDNFRSQSGLLEPGTTQYNPFHFASADASFETIEKLRDFVNGEKSKNKIPVDPEEISNYIKRWSKKLGAVDCGVTALKEYHLYSVGGRSERYGKKVVNNHKYAIAFTVEMAKEMVSSAPSGSMIMESGRQYLESGKIALQVAKFIRNLGYEARAHIDGNYEVICPLVARDAGLGEIGRMGLLMTPKLGPRVRISVVTTNLPLVTGKPLNDYSMIDFCAKCEKCAAACPGKAIPFGEMKETGGIKRWRINPEACFTLWTSLGTDCGRCVSVCPYSHPDNILHNTVRLGIKNSSIFRALAVKLDDLFYGRKPRPAKLPDWLRIKIKNN